MVATIEPTTLAENLVTVEQGAEMLTLCRSTVYQLLDSGRLASVRIPGVRSRRIPRWAIERLLVEGLTAAES